MNSEGGRSGEPSDRDRRLSAASVRRTLVAGATAVGAALAGCSDDSESNPDGSEPEAGGQGGSSSVDEEDDHDGSDGDGGGEDGSSLPGTTESSDTDTPTVDAFDGVRFDSGSMYIDLRSNADVAFVTLNTPHGDRFGRGRGSPDAGKQSVEQGETSAGPFELDPTSDDVGARYDPGTYTARAHQKQQRTFTDDEQREETELVEADRTEIELAPEVAITAVEPADASGSTTFAVENTGTGPAAVNVLTGRPGNGPRYNNKLEGTVVAPGETERITDNHVHEYDDDAESDEICNGETTTIEATLLLFGKPVTLYTVDLSLDGEVNESVTEKTCTRISGEITDEKRLPEKNF